MTLKPNSQIQIKAKMPTQKLWICTSPSPSATTDRYNAAGATSTTIKATNLECARAIAACLDLRLDGLYIN